MIFSTLKFVSFSLKNGLTFILHLTLPIDCLKPPIKTTFINTYIHGKKVIIMGGGIAGMTAAHELIERGFDVEIYESNTKYVGGKARSEDATVGPFNNIPGEHGFRFFRASTDTFRIP